MNILRLKQCHKSKQIHTSFLTPCTSLLILSPCLSTLLCSSLIGYCQYSRSDQASCQLVDRSVNRSSRQDVQRHMIESYINTTPFENISTHPTTSPLITLITEYTYSLSTSLARLEVKPESRKNKAEERSFDALIVFFPICTHLLTTSAGNEKNKTGCMRA